MKSYIVTFLAVVFLFSQTYANASVPELTTEGISTSPMCLEKVEFKNNKNGEDLYYKVLEELVNLKYMADWLGKEMPKILIPVNEIPKNAMSEFEAISKLDKFISIKKLDMYVDEQTGDLIPLDEANGELYKELGVERIIGNVEIIQMYQFSLNY